MGVRRRILLSLSVVAAAMACSVGSYSPAPGDESGGGPGGAGNNGAPDGGGAVSGDLPCSIAQLLVAHCTQCHGSVPANGAQSSLNSLAGLRAPSVSDPSKSNGQLALERMSSKTAPMPPAPNAPLSGVELSDFAAWISQGMPAGTCGADGGNGSGPDGGGIPDAGGGPASDAGVSGDLPCDVADVLVGRCTACHGSPPSRGAPMSLNSLTALRAPAPTQPNKNNGQLSVERMASTTSPMPPLPEPAVPSSKQAIIANWVNAGMPAGTCGAPSPDGGTDAGVDPIFAGPPTCSSGTYWTGGNNESPLMHPGLECISCHSRSDAPQFAIAGTIYPTGHEYDDCNGSAAVGAVVHVSDNAGVTRSFTANSAGNFYGSPSNGWPTFPIRAWVTFQGRTRTMSSAVPSGDCNSCHTLNGASGAPGRVALP
jgi:hypothetical protein